MSESRTRFHSRRAEVLDGGRCYMEAGSPPPPGSTPPQGPGSSGAIPTPQDAYETYPPAGRRPSRGWWAGAVAVAILALVGGYLVGYDRGQSSERDNYARVSPATTPSTSRASRPARPRAPRPARRAASSRARRRARRPASRRENSRARARARRRAQARRSADSPSWDTSLHYVIRVAEGPSSDVPYVISARTQMQAGDVYSLCQSDPTVVCVKPVTEPADSGG